MCLMSVASVSIAVLNIDYVYESCAFSITSFAVAELLASCAELAFMQPP